MKVSVNIMLNHKEINEKSIKVRELKNTILLWAIDGGSPADCPEELLHILRDLDVIDKHFLLLSHKIYNVKSREKGEEINYPDAE